MLHDNVIECTDETLLHVHPGISTARSFKQIGSMFDFFGPQGAARKLGNPDFAHSRDCIRVSCLVYCHCRPIILKRKNKA